MLIKYIIGKYIYSDEVVKYNSKVNIICLDHGLFVLRADHHLNGSGCPVCLQVDKFINKSNLIHNNFYTYTKEYNGYNEKLTIICPIHRRV